MSKATPETPQDSVGHHERAVNKFTAEDRFFSAIGRFIFEFSQLEYTLKHHVAEQVGLKDEYFTPVMTYDFAALCTIAETVLRPGMTEAAERLKKLIHECLSLNGHRVRIVHGLWFVGGEEGRLIHAPRGKIETKIYYERHNEVAKLAQLANRLRNELPDIIYRFKTRADRSPTKPTDP
jgi:hypothetical protein